MTQPDKAALKGNSQIISELRTENAELRRSADRVREATIEECAKIAGDIHLHTASMTQERDMAHRILPRVAKAIRALAALRSGMREAVEFPKAIFTHPSATAEGDKTVPIISNVRADGMREALEAFQKIQGLCGGSPEYVYRICSEMIDRLTAPQAKDKP